MKSFISKLYDRPVLLFLITLVLVFIIEGAIMYALYQLNSFLAPEIEGLIDALALTIILFPVFYFLAFRPLRISHQELSRKGEELEQRVVERTKELNEAQEQLIRSEKLATLGQLAGGISHDFNNILCAVRGFNEMALMDTDKESQSYECLKSAIGAVDRGTILTKQLLIFSRRHIMETRVIDLNDTVRNMLKMLDRLIGEDITIQTDLAPQLATIKADQGNIEQVIMNLLLNARDAMPKSGKITIKTENIIIDEEYHRLNPESRCGSFVCLSIADTGIGMDKDTVARVFEPFFTTKKESKGTGLGLSVVYGIVKKHDGWINVFSEPGQGAVFRIYLPASGEKAEPKQDTKTIVLDDIKGNGERILLVEDNTAIKEMVSRALTKIGYNVSLASTGKEAREIFAGEKGGFHLVLSDILLPDANGIELADEFLKQKPGLPIILSSGFPDKSEYSDEIQKRNLPFVPKPYQLSKLFKTIKEVIASRNSARY